MAPHQDLGGELAVLPQPGQHSLRVLNHGLHSDQARSLRVPETSVVQTDHIEASLLELPVQASPSWRSSVRSLTVQIESHWLVITEQPGTLLSGQRGGDTPDSETSSCPRQLHVVIPPSSYSEVAGVVQPVRIVGIVSREENQLGLELRNINKDTAQLVLGLLPVTKY